MSIAVAPAVEADLSDLADVAARTFPLACPPSAAPDDVAAFIAENLSAERLRAYLCDPDRVVLAARAAARILGYAMLIRGVPDDDDVVRAVTLRPAVELSKMYVLPDSHGAGVSTALMAAAIEHAVAFDTACLWLGVNRENQRAQRFYTKQGFVITGTKTFQLGDRVENDYVMVRLL